MQVSFKRQKNTFFTLWQSENSGEASRIVHPRLFISLITEVSNIFIDR